MRTAIAIGVAGALGALARYGVGGLISRRNQGAFPWETFVVNISGSFVLGFVFTLATERWALAPWLRSGLTIGFLGAYTTFSTFMLETYRLTEDRAHGLAVREHRRVVRRRPRCRLPRRRPGTGGMTRLEGDGKLVRIFIGESDTWHGKPLYQAIVQRVREEGLAGATVTRGIEGYGASSHLHTSRILRLSEDLPLVIEIVDTEERIEALLPILDEMVGDGLVTIETVRIVTYRASDSTTSGK